MSWSKLKTSEASGSCPLKWYAKRVALSAAMVTTRIVDASAEPPAGEVDQLNVLFVDEAGFRSRGRIECGNTQHEITGRQLAHVEVPEVAIGERVEWGLVEHPSPGPR